MPENEVKIENKEEAFVLLRYLRGQSIAVRDLVFHYEGEDYSDDESVAINNVINKLKEAEYAIDALDSIIVL